MTTIGNSLAPVFAAALMLAAEAAHASPVSVSHLIGARVAGAQGERIGSIDDLAVDVENRTIAYAIVDTRRPSDPEEPRMRAVRLEDLRPGLARDQLVLDPGAQPGAAAGGSAGARLLRASSLLGREVEHPSGARFGVIGDLEVDLATARLRSAVVRLDAGGGVTREVPFGALRFPAGGGAVILTLEEGSPR